MVGQVGDDQRTPREDWHPIGQFWTDGDFSVVVSKAGEGRLRTDAIRVEAQPEPPLEIDDGSFSYGELMGEWSTGVGGVGNQHRQAVGGQALYRLRVPPGTYALSAFLPRTEGGGPVTYALSAQGVSLGEFVVNQARGEDDWLAMGQYVFQNGPVHLSVEGVDGGPVIADGAVTVHSCVSLTPYIGSRSMGTPCTVYTVLSVHVLAPVGHAHWPSEHSPPAMQASPQAPQCAKSLLKSTQVSSHTTIPAGQAHRPALHAPPAGQVFPHVPQLSAPETMSTQAPSQWS